MCARSRPLGLGMSWLGAHGQQVHPVYWENVPHDGPNTPPNASSCEQLGVPALPRCRGKAASASTCCRAHPGHAASLPFSPFTQGTNPLEPSYQVSQVDEPHAHCCGKLRDGQWSLRSEKHLKALITISLQAAGWQHVKCCSDHWLSLRWQGSQP